MAVAIRNKINAMMPRLQPQGGTAGQALVKTTADDYASAWSKVNRTFGLSVFCSGKPAASETIGGGLAPYAFTITQNQCVAASSVSATASTTFIIRRAATQIGTVVFAAGTTVGTVTITSSAVAKGDRLTVVAPATADATLADITILLAE